jgi:hypothetical protein
MDSNYENSTENNIPVFDLKRAYLTHGSENVESCLKTLLNFGYGMG